jgi:hypothetical protein
MAWLGIALLNLVIIKYLFWLKTTLVDSACVSDLALPESLNSALTVSAMTAGLTFRCRLVLARVLPNPALTESAVLAESTSFCWLARKALSASTSPTSSSEDLRCIWAHFFGHCLPGSLKSFSAMTRWCCWNSGSAHWRYRQLPCQLAGLRLLASV